MTRIFISYSRTDETFARKLAADLEDRGADIWIDRDDIAAGDDWMTAIQGGLDSCDVMILVVSPDSMISPNVEVEWKYFRNERKKPIIPALWKPATRPFPLHPLHYIDFHAQDYDPAFKELCNAPPLKDMSSLPPVTPLDLLPHHAPLSGSILDLSTEFYSVLELGDLNLAKQMLDRISASDEIPAFFVMEQAERSLEIALKSRDAERAYEMLLRQEKHLAPEQARAALRAFWDTYPAYQYYDPKGIVRRVFPPVTAILPPPFEWVNIPAGNVTLTPDTFHRPNTDYLKRDTLFEIPAFAIAKYPITNAQYQVFVEADEGYHDPRWWMYSEAAQTWHTRRPDPKEIAYSGDDLPRTNLSWYEAISFCYWLSYQIGQIVTLPTDQEWQRAAQGDDGRTYPWGEELPNERLCNLGDMGHPTPVTQYPDGASPYGVMDMSGNVWEWCLTACDTGSTVLDGNERIMRGGSWYSMRLTHAACASRPDDHPGEQIVGNGFRIVCNVPIAPTEDK
ncbi:MAG: SUMF1/EgtB/PvdO family nonheme iron enzyme [Anaerolineae bacterium]|nr:SUMF1/EgtB/PvdO family nonheme iron enzyme [Anaerolineae bacterium]